VRDEAIDARSHVDMPEGAGIANPLRHIEILPKVLAPCIATGFVTIMQTRFDFDRSATSKCEQVSKITGQTAQPSHCENRVDSKLSA
jgi:hypothetical protein